MKLFRKLITLSTLFTIALILLCVVDGYALVHLFQVHSLDARLYYSYADIQRLFLELGPAGRARYFSEEIVDLTFLTSYTVLITQTAKWLFRRAEIEFGTRILLFCLLPGIFDFIETTGIMILLKRWPDLGILLPHAIQLATPLKWASGFFLLIYLIAIVTKTALTRV